MATASSRPVPLRVSRQAVVYPPPASSGCVTHETSWVAPVVGTGLGTYSGGFRTVRVVADGSGWNAHAAASSPAVGTRVTSNTPRLLWIRAVRVTLPRVVGTVPASSAVHRASRPYTAVVVP